jgi:hypothetical protein
MRKLWLTLGAILTLALIQVPAVQAAPSTACPDAGNQYIVDTALDAADLAEGYKNAVCDLIIRTSIPTIVGEALSLEAKSITIQGTDILDPSKRVEIINSNPGGDVFIKAVNGDVNITEAVVKSVDKLYIDCTNPNNCKINILFSEVMAPLSVLDPGGDVRVNARGDVRIENSTYFGGHFLYITSNTGSIVWFCPGSGECKDPVTSGTAATLCPGLVFPCQVTFNNLSELKAVCTQGTLCGGGDKEIRITAFIDIDISGSTITALDHVTLTAKTGKILAGKKGANITNLSGESWVFNAFAGADFSDAKIHTTKIIDISAGAGCPAAPAVCINARRSDMQSQQITMIANNKNGVIDVCEAKLDDLADNPKLNGDLSEPFDPNVVDTTLECAPAGKVVLVP